MRFLKTFKHYLHSVPAEYYFLITLVLSAAFLRLYNVFSRYTLGVESVRDAIVSLQAGQLSNWPLTGPFSSFGAFTFGPWYWYLLIIFHKILPVAYSSWILLSIVSILYVLILYHLGKQIGGMKMGLLAGFLAAVSPVQISSALFLTNPTFIHLFAALSLLFFVHLVKSGLEDKRLFSYALLFGLTIGIGINIHFQMVLFLLLPLLLLPVYKKNVLPVVVSYIGIMATFLPLFIFDVTHKWYMVRNVIYAYTTLGERVYVPNSWKIYLFDFWPYFTSDTLGLPKIVSFFLLGLLGLGISIALFQKKLNRSSQLLLVFFVLYFIYLRFYLGERSLSYVFSLQPFLFLTVAGYGAWLAKVKYGTLCLLLLLIGYTALVVPNLAPLLKASPSYLTTVEQQKSIFKNAPSARYRIYSCRGGDYATAQNLLFFLHKDGRLSQLGQKIGVATAECFATIKQKPKILFVESTGTYFVDLSDGAQRTGSMINWEELTLPGLYKTYVHWKPNE